MFLTKLMSVLVAFSTLASVALADEKEDKAKADAASLKGEWQVTSAESDGQPLDARKLPKWKLVFTADKVKGLKKGDEVAFELDPTKKPKEIDLLERGEVAVKAIYELEGDTLKVCWLKDNATRPTEFASTKGTLATFSRKKD